MRKKTTKPRKPKPECKNCERLSAELILAMNEIRRLRRELEHVRREHVTPNEFRRAMGMRDIETLNEAMARLKRDYRL